MAEGASPVRSGRTVAVIGAGPCGLTAAKNLLDLGHRVTLFEADDAVGGNWRLADRTGHASSMATTRAISSKRFSAFEDFRFPSDYPDYPSQSELLRYFEAYARHFELYPHIRFGHRVTRCAPQGAGGWAVTVEASGRSSLDRFDALVVANGHHWNPRMPELPGAFAGRLLHSHAVKDASGFAGERVLIIGGGNSACDCAAEISRAAAQTDMSWRRGYWIMPKYLFGRPSDKMLFKIRKLPRWLRTGIAEQVLRFYTRDLGAHGFPRPDHHFGASHPTINSTLLDLIREKRIRWRPELRAITGSRVRFVDGGEAAYDTIVAATGYRISHPFFDPALIDFSRGPVPLYLRMLPANLPGLYFIGLFQPLGPIWPAAELQARIAARHLAGLWQPPADLAAAIAHEQRHPDYRQIDTPRHSITVDYFAFRERLLRELPSDHRGSGPSARMPSMARAGMTPGR